MRCSGEQDGVITLHMRCTHEPSSVGRRYGLIQAHRSPQRTRCCVSQHLQSQRKECTQHIPASPAHTHSNTLKEPNGIISTKTPAPPKVTHCRILSPIRSWISVQVTQHLRWHAQHALGTIKVATRCLEKYRQNKLGPPGLASGLLLHCEAKTRVLQ